MSNKDYYPAGAYNDPNAPYNEEPEPAPKKVKCLVTITLTKEVEVETTDYLEWPYEDKETNSKGVEVDYSNCDFYKDYLNDNDTMSHLLFELSTYYKDDSEKTEYRERKLYLERHLKIIDGWNEEIEVERL